MEAIIYIGASLLAATTAAGVARGVWKHRDEERRRVERVGYQERRDAERRERGQAAVRQLDEGREE